MDKEKIREKLDDILENKVAPIPKNIKIAIYVVLCALPVALFVYFVYMPGMAKIEELKTQQGVLEKELAEVAAAAADLEKHKAEMVKTGHLLELASVLLPQKKDIPSLLTNISDLGIQSGLEFLSFSPAAEKPLEFYSEVPLNVTVKGPYHNVLNYLYQVSKLDRIVSATSVTMGGAAITKGENVLSATLSFVTYRFNEATTDATTVATTDETK